MMVGFDDSDSLEARLIGRARPAVGEARKGAVTAVLLAFAGASLFAQLTPDGLFEAQDEIFEQQDQRPEEETDEVPGEQMPAEERLDRITFEVPFPAEEGGGVALGSAGNLEYVRQDYVVATDGVELRYQDLKFQGQRVEIDLEQRFVIVSGDAILDQGPRRLIGDTLEFDLDTKTGSVTNAKAFVDPDVFFEGETITKIDEDTYTVQRGLMTSCADRVPDWNFRVSSGRITVDGLARAKNARFRVKKAPLLYLPYIVYPAKSQRTSGFLFPNLGYSERRGGVLGLAYFQTLGQSADTTFYLDLYTDEYYGLGNEIRYQPSQSTQGIFEGYAVRDPVDDAIRWRGSWYHTSDNLPLGFRGVLRFQDFSDFDYFRDYERDFSRASIRRVISSGFLTGNWGQHSLTLLAEQNKTFISAGDEAVLRQLPEIEYRLRATQILSLPIYFEVLGSANNLGVERGDVLNVTYPRADLFPQVTVPLSSLPWLSFSVTAGERLTWYGDSLSENRTEYTGESLTRAFTVINSNVVGPSFSRVFDKKIGRFARFKHIIEPRASYVFVDEFEDQNRVPLFDQVDALSPVNVVNYALVNRVLAKPEDEELHGGAREIFSFELNQAYSLDKDKPFQRGQDGSERQDGPVGMRLRFNPSKEVSVESQASYSTLYGRLSSASISGGAVFGRQGVGATLYTRFNPATGDTTSNQLRLYTGLEIWRDRLRLDSQFNYDFIQQILQSQRHTIQYFSQCFGMRVELWEIQSTVRLDRQFRFALTLKNIGTFLDLTGGTRTGFSPNF